MTIKYLSDEQALKYVIALENLKNKWLERLDACALDGEMTLDDVLLMLLEGVRAINNEGQVVAREAQKIHVRLYEVRPLNNTSILALKAFRAQHEFRDFQYNLDVMLYLKFDTFIGLYQRAPHDLTEEKRYLPIINGSVIGDVYMGEMPVVCVEKPLDVPDSEIVGNVHYGAYEKCRLSRSHNRAAFPVMNRRTKEVEYIVVIEKKEFLLNPHEIRYVRNFLARAHEAIVIKDLENRAHLHDKDLKRRLHDLNNMFQMIDTNIGLALDLVPNDDTHSRLKMALTDAKKNFAILTEHLKSSSENHRYYDMRAHAMGPLISAKLKSYEQYDFYRGHLKFSCQFDCGDRRVLMDKKMFYLALDNMTKNTFEALKNPDGTVDDGKTAHVSIETSLRDGFIVLRYMDNCGGMDPILYDSVMRRGACKTTKQGGSGFGVASILSTFRDFGCVIDPVNHPGKGFGYEITMKVEADPGRHVYMDTTTGETVGN